MKKFTLFALLIVFSMVTFAQKNTGFAFKAPAAKRDVDQTKAVLWSSDFSNSSNWTISNGAGNSDNWVIGTTGPSGSYPINPIASTTAANGFALFDSDLLCSGNQDGFLTVASPIDLSSVSNVTLSFESYYRKYTDSIFVGVSTDGSTWTSFEIHSTYALNDMDATNPTVESLDITSVAAGNATVWIRFEFRSLSASSADGCDYSWMIDDVTITDEALTPDLALTGAVSSAYTIIPLFFTPSFDFAGNIGVTGADLPAGQVVNASEIGGSYTGSGTSASVIAVAAESMVDITPAFTPTTVGIYEIAFQSDLTGDGDVTNNYDTVEVAVSDTVLARDFGPDGGSMGIGDGSSGILGQLFEIKTNSVLTSVTFMLVHPTAETATAKVYAYDGTTVTGSELATSVAINLDTTTAAANSYYTVPINANLTAGTYFIGIEEPSAGNITLSTSPIAEGIAEAWVYYNSAWAAASSFGFYQTYVLRANITNFVSVNDISATSSISVYPNPANNIINVVNAEDAKIFVVNMLGEVVTTIENASSNQTIDLSNLSEGTYFVKVNSEVFKINVLK